jgi:hypothetical protein
MSGDTHSSDSLPEAKRYNAGSPHASVAGRQPPAAWF